MRLAKPLWRGRWTAHVAIVNPETSHCLFGAFWKRWRAISTVAGSWAVLVPILAISKLLGKLYSEGSRAARYHPSINLSCWQRLKRSQKATLLSPAIISDRCDGRQNARSYCSWCERHMLSICNREQRQSPPSPTEPGGTGSFVFLHAWSHKTEPCPSENCRKAQHSRKGQYSVQEMD